MERALLEHIDQRIKLATREAVREPLTASMVDLYCYIKNDYNVFMSHFSVPRVECVLVGSEFSTQNDIFICFFFLAGNLRSCRCWILALDCGG